MQRALLATTLGVIALLVVLFFLAIFTFQDSGVPEFEVYTLEDSRLVAEDYLSRQDKFLELNGENISLVNAINTGCDSCWVLQFEFDSDVGVSTTDVHMMDGRVVF